MILRALGGFVRVLPTHPVPKSVALELMLDIQNTGIKVMNATPEAFAIIQQRYNPHNLKLRPIVYWTQAYEPVTKVTADIFEGMLNAMKHGIPVRRVSVDSFSVISSTINEVYHSEVLQIVK